MNDLKEYNLLLFFLTCFFGCFIKNWIKTVLKSWMQLQDWMVGLGNLAFYLKMKRANGEVSLSATGI